MNNTHNNVFFGFWCGYWFSCSFVVPELEK